jgi:hypothetical protein
VNVNQNCKEIALVRFVSALLLILILFPSIDFAAGRGTLVWPRTIGEDKWPLTTKFARVYCTNLGNGRKAVFLTSSPDEENLYDYAVNGTARGAMKKLNLRDISPIMKEGKLPYHLQPFIEIGLEECSK